MPTERRERVIIAGVVVVLVWMCVQEQTCHPSVAHAAMCVDYRRASGWVGCVLAHAGGQNTVAPVLCC